MIQYCYCLRPSADRQDAAHAAINAFAIRRRRFTIVSTGTVVLLIILAILIVGVVVLYFLGKRLQKKQEAQQAQIDAAGMVPTLYWVSTSLRSRTNASV